MSRSEQIFIAVLIINTIIAIAYLLWGVLFHRKNELGEHRCIVYILRAIVIFLCPVTGVCFFLLSELLRLVFFRAPVDLDDVIFSKERKKTIQRADEEREKNIVPLEEALSVTDHTKLRQLMLNVLKGDIDQSLSTIALALDSEDSETSHYAASILSKALNEFRINVRKLQQEINGEEDPVRKAECGILLLDYMNGVLCQKVFTLVEQRYFVDAMHATADLLYREMIERREKESQEVLQAASEQETSDSQEEAVQIPEMEPNQYYNLTLRTLELEDFDRSRLWSDRGLEEYQGKLEAYKAKLKLLFATNQQKEFLQVLEQLKESEISIDNETLEMIRVFDRR